MGNGVLKWLVVLGIVFAAAPAHAGRGLVIITTGEDVVHLRDLTVEEQASFGAFASLGYKHEYFGVFWVDVLRYGGEYVVYTGDSYAELDDQMLAYLHPGSVPITYFLPPGLLIILALIEIGVVGSKSRPVGVVMIAGGAMGLIALTMLVLGAPYHALIPLACALFHAYGIWHARHGVADDDEPLVDRDYALATEGVEAATAADPNWPPREPPRPSAPIIVTPATATPTAPIVEDPSAKPPSLLG
jgi:hypothetical protein